uniref:Putative tyrosine kinase eph ephrin receptor family n=1 Tax=Ixodes scapularis TaxID=6945 RepID=A0A4D5RGI3_IXOSC
MSGALIIFVKGYIFISACLCASSFARQANYVQAEEPHGNVFDWRGIESNNTDLVFLLDRSGSVGQAGFEVETGFVHAFLKGFDVAPNTTRVAVISFSEDAVVHADFLKDPGNKCHLSRKMQGVHSANQGATNTGAGLQAAWEVFQRSRPTAKKLLILVTDGMATMGPDPVKKAEKLKKMGVDIFVFGIGRMLKQHLEQLASTPANVSECESFSAFQKTFGEGGTGNRWNLDDNPRNCDYLCRSPYRGQPDDPGCCDKNAICGCSMATGTSNCLCGPGFEGTGLEGQCKACNPGTYKEEHDDKTRCKSCPQNSTTAHEGSRSIKDCVCKKAHVGDPTAGKPCVPVTCPPLQPPEHGSIIDECSTAYKSECEFDCDEGFELMEQESGVRTCQEDGTWSGATVVCVPKQCDEPPIPENGYAEGCDGDRAVGTTCTYSCIQGHRLVGESTTVCTPHKTWTNTGAACNPVECPPPPYPAYAAGLGDLRRSRPYLYKDWIKPQCLSGFELQGPVVILCEANGQWMGPDNQSALFSCVDKEKPQIQCPQDEVRHAEARRSYARIAWSQPEVKDNSGEVPFIQKMPENITSPWRFPIGKTEIRFKATDAARLSAVCTFTVTVLDEEKPLMTSCPQDIHVNTTDLKVKVSWREPLFEDNSGYVYVKQSHHPGSEFTQGSTKITYTGTDGSRNTERCVFKVVVSKSECPYHPPPENGALSCDSWLHGEFCQPFCNERFDFLDETAEEYICDKDRTWQTVPPGLPVPWPDCAATTEPLEHRRLLRAHYYTGDCREAHVQEAIKRAFRNNYYKRVQKTVLCESGALCKLDNVRVKCGRTGDANQPPSGTVTVRHRRSLDTPVADEPNSVAELDAEFSLVLSANNITATNDTEELSSAADEVLESIGEIEDSVLDEVMTEENALVKMDLIDFAVGDTHVICAEGQALNGNECTICPSGTFHDMEKDLCSPCPMGTYQDDDGRTSCKSCPNGTSTEAPKRKSLDDCQPPCAPGTYSSTGLGPCMACPQGTFQDKTQQTFCQFCPRGSTTEGIGSLVKDNCKRYCQPGSYSKNGLEPCQPCPRGFYQTTQGQKTCQECRVPTTTLQEGSKSSFDCILVDHCSSAPCSNGTCRNTQHGFLCEP